MIRRTAAAFGLSLGLALAATPAIAQAPTFDASSLDAFNQSAATVAADLPARSGSKLQLAIQVIVADYVVRNDIQGALSRDQLLTVLKEDVGGMTAEEVFARAAELMTEAAEEA